MFSSQRVNNTVETESLTTSSVICLDYTEGKNRQDYLQNDYLRFNENAVVAKNTYEKGCSENLQLVRIEEHFKYHHCIEALEVICLSS